MLRSPIYECDLSVISSKGTFSELESHLPRLKKMGIGIVWLMPIYLRGGNPMGKPRSDSPYCVRDYQKIDPRFGTDQEFSHLVDAAHKNGLRIIMDFVPNHTSWGHSWIQQHPEFYCKDEKGEIVSPDPWYDVAKLDYTNKRLWQSMLDIHRYWIDKFGIDGFREDVAGGPPLAFWKWLKPKLSSRRILLLAEAQGGTFIGPFQADYDWQTQAAYYKISKGDWDSSAIDAFLQRELAQYPKSYVRMRHLDNHDMADMRYAWPNRDCLEPSEYPFLEQVPLSVKYGAGYRAFAVLNATLPNSQPMIWNGEEAGVIDSTPRPLPLPGAGAHVSFYTKLFGAYNGHRALRDGRFIRVKVPEKPSIYAFWRELGQDKVLVIVNLSSREETVALKFRTPMADVFTGRMWASTQRLAPWEYQIWVRK